MKRILFSLLVFAVYATANTCTEAYFQTLKPIFIQAENSLYIDSTHYIDELVFMDDTLRQHKYTKFIYENGRLQKYKFGYVVDSAEVRKQLEEESDSDSSSEINLFSDIDSILNSMTTYATFIWSNDESILSGDGDEELLSDSTWGDTTYIHRKCYYDGDLFQEMRYKYTSSYIYNFDIDHDIYEESLSEVFFRNDSIILKSEDNFSYVVGDPNDDSKCYAYANNSLFKTFVYQKKDKGFSIRTTAGNNVSETFMIDPKKQTLSIHKRRVPVKISPKARYFDLLGRYKFTR